MPGPAVAGR
jgi:hypothetical protein